MISTSVSIAIIVTAFFTSILSGVLGMAGGMVLMGVLAWILPVQQAMILHATTQFFANGSRALIHHSHIYWRGIAFYTAALVMCLALFSLITLVPDKRTVFAMLGIIPFASAALPKKMKLDFTRPFHAFACGTIVTTLHLTGGVSGAMLDVFFQQAPMTRHAVISTKAATQTLSHVARLFYFGLLVSAPAEAFGALPVWLYAGVIVSALLGTNISKHIINKISDRQFFRATQTMLFGIGTIYLWKAFSL